MGRVKDDLYKLIRWHETGDPDRAPTSDDVELQILNDALERITKMQPVYDAAMRYHKIREKLHETPTDAVADAEFELSQAFRDACKEVDNG